MTFPTFRQVGAPAGEGKCTLRIRSKREEGSDWIETHVFAVMADGTEVEVEDVLDATWKSGGDGEVATSTLTVMGTELDADVEAVAIAFKLGKRDVTPPEGDAP